MLLKQRCIVILLLDLKCPMAQISRMFGLSMKDVKKISSDIELIRKLNNSKFSKNCLEVSDFSTTQVKLRLNYIQTLLYHVIQKFSRWARRVNFIDRSDNNNFSTHCPPTKIQVDNTFILHIWLLLKNIILHHPTVSYKRINRTVHNISFKKQKKSGLARHLIGTRPTSLYLMTALKELRSKSHFHYYSI